MDYLSLFRMPTPIKITGRSSSITNAFINSVIPAIAPTNEQVQEALAILGMDFDGFQCAYCGGQASEWDHLRPLVINKQPTGFITEIHNLVPACGKCNQSKGNKKWDTWIVSDAKLSPKTRKIPDLEKRIERLKMYEAWQKPSIVDFEAIVGKEKWQQHWKNWQLVQDTMREAQLLANEMSIQVAKSFFGQGASSGLPSTMGHSDESRKDMNTPNQEVISIRVGDFVKDHLSTIIEYCKQHPEHLKQLCDKAWSKHTFDINYPFMALTNKLPQNQNVRYWQNIFLLNNESYRFCSQFGGTQIIGLETKSEHHGGMFKQYLVSKNILLPKFANIKIQFRVSSSQR